MDDFKAFLLFFVPVFVTVVTGLLANFALQIAMIVLGTKYKDECPVQDMIPIYLIVAGAAGLFGNCCGGGLRRHESYSFRSSEREEYRRHEEKSEVHRLVELLRFVWFVCGNVWIYSNYEPNYTDPSSADYCNKTLYLFAFWATTSYYIIQFVMLCASLLGSLAAIIMVYFWNRRDSAASSYHPL